MITEEQEKQIMDYLMSKNLTLDMLVEIKDHMLDQVTGIQETENISFEDAFSQVKESWGEEFTMTRYFFYSGKIPVIAKKIIKTKYNGLLKKSLLIAMISFALNILLIYCSNSQETYTIAFRILNSVFFITPIVVVALNYNNGKLMGRDYKYKGKLFYTLYQTNISLLTISTTAVMQLMGKDGHHAYLFFRNQDHTDLILTAVTLILPFIMQTLVAFALFNYLEHQKTVKKIQYFLA
ncbi:hypothetical protein N6B72_19790 [Chryseobacterium soli]|uniref:hypothetical protein n=1 Tax=Chryseobacterium soli TaxID=445961 RepID=UPI002954BBD6|nr:hypothetical protein [Chryseobacterium soli]MDV7699167.1 hypothetical protein [Chryseobacterium soli]